MKVLNQAIEKDFSLYHGDCVEAIAQLPDNSIGLTVSSIPFSNLYTYSASPRDMGNTESDEHFLDNLDYLIPELYRVTIPGRLCVIHIKDLPLFLGSDDAAGLRDLPAQISDRFTGGISTILSKIDALTAVRELLGKTAQKAIDSQIKGLEIQLESVQQTNWVLHSKVTIWKCPETEMKRTNNSGLLHKNICEDSSMSRQGMAEYLLIFRKWHPDMAGLKSTQPVNRKNSGAKFRFDKHEYIGTNPPFVSPTHDPRGYSIAIWQRYASPVWMDIDPKDVLNTNAAKTGDEPHMCPLQLDVIRRCVELWTNSGDVVFDPFNGISSTGVVSLGMQRRYVGIELKKEYYEHGLRNLRAASIATQTTFQDYQENLQGAIV
jgi:DNA modification methylase